LLDRSLNAERPALTVVQNRLQDCRWACRAPRWVGQRSSG